MGFNLREIAAAMGHRNGRTARQHVDSTLSGLAVWRMVQDELGIKVRRRSWYVRYWRPTLDRLGLQVRKPGFGSERESRYTPGVQIALRDFVRARMAGRPAVSPACPPGTPSPAARR